MSETLPPLSPSLALDLRIRYLEALLTPHSAPDALPLARRVAALEQSLLQALDAPTSTDALRRFVRNCTSPLVSPSLPTSAGSASSHDANAPLLSPAFAAALPPPPLIGAGSGHPAHEQAAQLALVLEAETDLRALERELRQLDVLDQRDVASAGKLGELDTLVPTLRQAREDAKPVAASYAELEARALELLQRYNHDISTMSEVLVAWDDILGAAEAQLGRLEKARRAREEYDVA